eukprot:996658-Rhodomonas_salina.2
MLQVSLRRGYLEWCLLTIEMMTIRCGKPWDRPFRDPDRYRNDDDGDDDDDDDDDDDEGMVMMMMRGW